MALLPNQQCQRIRRQHRVTARLVAGVMLKSHLLQFLVHIFAESRDGELVQVPDVRRRSAERVQHLQSPQRPQRRRLHRFLDKVITDHVTP